MNRRVTTWLLLSAIALPAILCFALIAYYQVNIPYLDDYFAILGFADHLQQLTSPADRLSWMLAAQHVDYKLVFLHVVVAAQLALTQHVNFVWLNAVGNSFLLWTAVLLGRTYFTREPDLNRRLLLLLPISLLWFGVNYAEAVDWAAGSLLYQPVIFFSLLALHLLAGPDANVRSRARFGGACAAAAVACLTAVNAALLGPIGLVLLLARRSFLRAALWCVAIAVGLIPYVYKYTPVAHPFQLQATRLVLFFLAFVGSGVPAYKLAIPAGLIVLCTLAWSLRTGFARRYLSAVLGALWLLGSGVLVAIGRSHGGLEFSQISRYKLFSDLLLVFCYGVFMDFILTHPLSQTETLSQNQTQTRRRWLQTAAVTVALLFFVRNTLIGAAVLSDMRDLLEGNARFYWADPVHHSPMHHDRADLTAFWAPFAKEEKEDLEDSMRRSIYTLPGNPQPAQSTCAPATIQSTCRP